MIKQLGLFGATLAISAAAILPTTAADAQRSRYDRRYHDRSYYEQGYNDRQYRGYDDRRPYKKCSDGTTGAVVGAVAGGLLGRVIDRHGERTTGTLLGAGGGLLAGRAIERDGAKNAANDGRCYR